MAEDEKPSKEKQEKPTPAVEPVRYVEVASSSGWQTVSKTVREIDEEKIKDAKEDIDNLLVFAGLFSAVLTAFLIESYTALQPDPQSEMVFLLHRIATQNYSMNGGFLNVSSAIASHPPFEAPTWALRVNGLWFSSLIVSLSAASLGILVKSWLREYLAGEWISPQEKLRARQYRNPALSQWKVFEIAAALPLLLQLALGLFFVGLCFFTASVDERMALTSIPIVAAWAFFLAMTTVAPLLTPRCPFKIPFLKRALKSGRRHLLPRVRQLLEFLLTTTEWSTSLGSKQEEEEFVRGGQEGADLLLSLDAIMADDSLLYTLWDAFKQSSPSPEKSIQFILRLIRHRMGSALDSAPSEENLTYLLDLSGLSQRAYETTTRMAAEVLKPAPTPYQNSSADWVHNAIIILLSRSTYSLPHDALSVLHTFLDDKSASWWTGDTIGIRFTPVLENRAVTHTVALSTQLLHLYTSTSLTRLELTSPLRLYNRMLKILGEVENGSVSILSTVRSNPRLLVDDRLRPILEDVWKFAAEIVQSERLLSARGGSLECLLLVSEIGSRLGKTYELSKLLSGYWSTFRKRFLTAMLFCSAAPHMRISNPTEMSEVFEEAFFTAEPKTQGTILTNSTDVAKTFCADAYTAEKGYDPLDMVLFTYQHLRIYRKLLNRPKDDLTESPPAPEWSKLWSETHLAIRRYWDTKGWSATLIKRSSWEDPAFDTNEALERDRETAAECLTIIEMLADQGASMGRVGGRRSASSMFVLPEKLTAALKLFGVPTDGSNPPPSTPLASGDVGTGVETSGT